MIGFTEMGTWGANTDEAERVFKDGTMTIMEVIEEYGNCPVQADIHFRGCNWICSHRVRFRSDWNH